MARKLKTGDEVYVIAGDEKGSKGTISKVDTRTSRVYIQGINVCSRHVKPSAQNPEGGVVKKERSIHISNVLLVAPNTSDSLIWSKKIDHTCRVPFCRRRKASLCQKRWC